MSEVTGMDRLEDITWQGYARQDGRKGIRNRVVVIYTVKCAEHVARRIAEDCRHPDVEVLGFDGCTDNQYAVDLMIALIRHPNVGAVLAVGLGCEYVQPEWLSDIARKAGKPADWMFIQREGGTRRAVERGLKWVGQALELLKLTPRVAMGLADLTVGAECGGSDYTSGLAGNVVVGRFFDRLVDAGGTAVFEEIVEAVGLGDILMGRAANGRARDEIGRAYSKMLDYCKSVRQYSVSPGNFAGGLSTIEEKSMGAVAKSGSRPIQGVLKVSQTPPHPGLWLLDSVPDPHWMQFGITNPNDSEGLMDLISCGAQLVFLVTGRGSVVGSAVAPCIKITGNGETYARMSEDMDFDASPVLAGTKTMDALTDDLLGRVISTASGQPSCAEALGHREYYIPYKYQDRPRACEEDKE